MVKYYGRAKTITGSINTNQSGLNMSGTASSVGHASSVQRYINRRVDSLAGVCGIPKQNGGSWRQSLKNKHPYCRQKASKCLAAAGGVGRPYSSYYKTPDSGVKGCGSGADAVAAVDDGTGLGADNDTELGDDNTVINWPLTYNISGGGVAVTNCAIAATATIVIPSTITINGAHYNVTIIGATAFENCVSVPAITIPNTVTTIASLAFAYCYALTSITIPDSVTSIGSSAFNGCNGLTSITIPNSVTTIGANAFQGCIALTSITIPDSVTSIGSSAFENCNGLTSITIPNNVTSIAPTTFAQCIGLTSITIPDSITSIDWLAFYGCTSLTSVTIGSSVTTIGDSTFQGCTKLSTVQFLGGAPTVGMKTFPSLTPLATAVVTEANLGSFGVLGANWNGLRLASD